MKILRVILETNRPENVNHFHLGALASVFLETILLTACSSPRYQLTQSMNLAIYETIRPLSSQSKLNGMKWFISGWGCAVPVSIEFCISLLHSCIENGSPQQVFIQYLHGLPWVSYFSFAGTL